MYILLDFRITQIFKALCRKSAKLSCFAMLIACIPWILSGTDTGNISGNGRAWWGWWPTGHAGERGSWRHWGQPQPQPSDTCLEMWTGQGLDGDGGRMGRGPAGEPDSAGPMARKGMAVGSWRPVKLQHCWGRGCPGLYLSPLSVCSWRICSWDEELQKDVNWFFHIYPPKSAENIRLMKN